jgi:c-di-GMP-binding flagellar brake protein YcgR
MPVEDKADQTQQDQDNTAHWERYAIRGWREVLFYLHGIQAQKLLVHLFLTDSKEFIISSLLEINERSGELILDGISDHPFNRKAVHGAKMRVETSLDNIGIMFDTTVAELAHYQGRPAIRARLPDSLVRLQRREHFRVSLPIVKPVNCVIPADAARSPVPVNTVVLDLSLGGVAIAENMGIFDPRAGDTLAECEIALPEVGLLRVDLRVHSVAHVVVRAGRKKKRVGCSFVQLPNPMAATLQRFIMKLEREWQTRK